MIPNNTTSIIFLFLVLVASFSCRKEQDPLKLDNDYLFVTDIQQYCSGNCDEISIWENHNIYAKGHVIGIENDSLMQDYFNNNRFYLNDIRTGIFIMIRINDDKMRVFDKLNAGKKDNMLFLKGIAEAVIASSGEDCTKGVVIEISNADDIWFE